MELSLAELAGMIEGKLIGDSKKMINKAAPFEDAKENDITFAGTARFLSIIKESSAGAVIVPHGYNEPSKNLIQVEQPHIAFIKVLNIFYPPSMLNCGISSSAHVGEGFKCGKGVSVAPNAVIGNNVIIGDRVSIYSCSYIGDGVVIGDDVKIYSNVSVLERCKIGNRVIIQAGSVIGSDGFGYSSDGNIHYKIPHMGIVQIDDDVEIGAGNTIDRATFGKTWICRGVKTDNLVHIAHNVTVGEDTLLIAQVVIGGSASIGKHSIISGQAVIGDHIVIGDNVTIAAKSGVIRSVKNGEIMTGAPAIPHRLWLRVQNVIPKLPEIRSKLFDIEKRLNRIEKQENK
ncbi:MAG: UDP-3-O-(3-hydroxymyristoyl)glucosamine N-acyltransferase [Desulfobacterium sp.]|nr:UDP-3-O-(3-hydroxymyristoyl)glucosamine N-acyltransferase [Desulfobacterium sp.]MBU3947056.1 UDP-3-O-(3-hydroxymyristoyl)glucosamine N-acyltransferase [Pseudomonadota bacterium]MBU4037243.1 UDP-3-O-(3-hydroxymyristoyl)glucosamine N-acyltransferase [Pseudomonadota bacterium]